MNFNNKYFKIDQIQVIAYTDDLSLYRVAEKKSLKKNEAKTKKGTIISAISGHTKCKVCSGGRVKLFRVSLEKTGKERMNEKS